MREEIEVAGDVQGIHIRLPYLGIKWQFYA